MLLQAYLRKTGSKSINLCLSPRAISQRTLWGTERLQGVKDLSALDSCSSFLRHCTHYSLNFFPQAFWYVLLKKSHNVAAAALAFVFSTVPYRAKVADQNEPMINLIGPACEAQRFFQQIVTRCR